MSTIPQRIRENEPVVGVPGTAVVTDAKATRTVKLAGSTFSLKALPPDYTITPGGARHRSMVNEVQPGTTIRIGDGPIKILDRTMSVIQELQPGAADPDLPGFGTGWVTFATAPVSTATPITSLVTTWTVPPPPRTQSGQIIYLFNAFQVNIASSNPALAGIHILQPVLQWGTSPDGGGNNWAIASWLVGGPNQPVGKTPLINVNPGTILTGVISLVSQSGGFLNYSCQFQGFPGSLLNLQTPTAPYVVAETLECYGLQQATDFPNTGVTAMTGISVQTGASSPALTWTPANSTTDSGQYTVVANSSNPGGAVDLFYGYTVDLAGKKTLSETSSDSPSLASQNGMLFLGWKGSGNDNLNVSLSADNGATFINKLISNESSDLAPSLAAHNGLLMICWKGSGNDNINVAQVPLTDNNAGAYAIHPFANKITLGDTTGAAPAIASHNGILFLAWKGSGNDNLNVMLSLDGGHSFIAKMTSPETSSSGPVLVSHNGKLLIAWKGSGNDNLNVAEISFSLGAAPQINPFINKTILSDTSSATPALASSDGILYLAWRGSGNNDLNVMLSPDDGQTFTGKCIYSEFSDIAPALTSHQGGLFLAWKGSGNDNLNVAPVSLDGDLTLLAVQEDLTGKSGSVAAQHQDPINQLDVLAVDSSGAVAVSWVTGEQAWAGPKRLTSSNFAPPNAGIALAHQTSAHQLDALLVDNSGSVNVLWVTDGGAWQGPARLSPVQYAPPGSNIALAHQTALNQLDAMFVDVTGAVNVLWVGGEGAWQGPVRLTRGQTAPAGGAIAMAHQTSTFQLDAMFVDTEGAVNVMWVAGEGAWQGPVRLTPPRTALAGGHIAMAHQSSTNQLDALFVDMSGALAVMWVTSEEGWNGPVRLTGPGFARPGASVALGHQTSMQQLDAFVADASGAVSVMWVGGEGTWNGPAKLTAPGFTQPSACIGISHQTSIHQLDIFVPDSHGTLNVLWVADEGAWQGPVPLPGSFVI